VNVNYQSSLRATRKLLFVATLLASMSACELKEEAEAINEVQKTPKVWLYVQVNVPVADGQLKTHYYYARVSESLYNKIAKNEIGRGFLFLEDVRYYGNDDKVYSYADDESSGDLVYRIEDIKSIEKLKKPPRLAKDVVADKEEAKKNEATKPNAEENQKKESATSS
jgi:hypothetical protein